MHYGPVWSISFIANRYRISPHQISLRPLLLGRSPGEHFETSDNPCKMLLRRQLEQTTGYPMGVLEQGMQFAL